MALIIEDPEAERLARELAAETGATITQAVVQALRDRLARRRRQRGAQQRRDRIRTIRQSMARLPLLDEATDEAFLGYDGSGLPS